MSQKLDQRAIPIARQYLGMRGYTAEDVNPEDQKGYNLIVRSGQELFTIAVKGCTRLWKVPDLLPTEVNPDRHLVADFLYVVYFDGSKEPKLCIIPREALKPEFVVPNQSYHITAKLKKATVLRPFLHAL